ncbi:MAG: phage terminase large subunit [Candidatus Omnitrophota bacterium]|jgi:predicted phage terminase large subunit-like protein
MKIADIKKAGVELSNKKLIEIRRRLFKDFLKFRKYYFKEYHESPDADFHKELSTLLMDITRDRNAKVAIAAPRDSAKSTIISLEYVIYCVCHKIENYIVIISNSREQAIGFLRDIKHELDSNKLLMQDFPEACDRQVKPKPAPWKEGEIITPNGVKITALGTDQEIRGRRNKKDRPSLIILDDIETTEPIQNPENANKLEDWLTKSVLKAGVAKANIIYTGTVHHYGSLLAKFTGNDAYPGWIKRIYRSVISDPERMDLWDQWRRIFNRKEQYKGKDSKEGATLFFEDYKDIMLKGVKVLWPERKSYHDLMIQREVEGSFSFDSEMQNEPINRRDCMFSPEDLHFWDNMYGSEEELLQALSATGNIVEFFGGCDPSMGKEHMRGDRSAIITIVKVLGDSKIYVLDADIDIRQPDKLYRDILMRHRQRGYSYFAFEVVGAQEAMAMALSQLAIDEGIPLNIYETRPLLQHKITRIQTLQPMIKNGDILFSKTLYRLLEEMKYFPKGRFKDGLDALQMAVEACLNAPFLSGGYPQAFPGYNNTSDVLKGQEDLRYIVVPRVYREQKDRFVPPGDGPKFIILG